MAPFTPFISETLYQQLRVLHPAVNDDTAAEDAPGHALSVHYLNVPDDNPALLDPTTLARVDVLQVLQRVSAAARRQCARAP